MRKRRRINKTESERRRFKPFSQRSIVNCFVLLLLRSIRARQIRLSSSFFVLRSSFFVCLRSSVLSSRYVFRVIKQRRLMTGRVKKKWSGLTRVWPGQFPSGFWPPPGPVPCPGRPGPGSTRGAGPGLKTMTITITTRITKKSIL